MRDNINEILHIIEKHLKETKRVYEIFDQFNDVLKNNMKKKVNDILERASSSREDRTSEKDFA